MNFAEAFLKLLAGGEVRRSSWPEDQTCRMAGAVVEWGDGGVFKDQRHLTLVSGGDEPVTVSWTPSTVDLFAEDWG